MLTPLAGEKEPKSGTRPKPAHIGDSRTHSKKRIPRHPVKKWRRKTPQVVIVSPLLSYVKGPITQTVYCFSRDLTRVARSLFLCNRWLARQAQIAYTV